MNKLNIATLITIALTLSACGTGMIADPFTPPTQPEAYLGERNDHALGTGAHNPESARDALEAMASYQRAHAPQPVNPVMQPAVVRLMWVPDHLNSNGDLVPAHYYYLKVLGERWAVSDAFELEQQLNGPQGAGGSGASSLPYIYSDQTRR